MPRRWIDPTFFTDEKLAKATLEERHVFAAMIANQDDDGRLLGHPGYLRSIAFPYDDFSNDQVKHMRDHLAEVNPNVIVYQNAGNEYVQLKRHHRYQRPRYYHPSKFPAPPGWPFKDEVSQNNSEVTEGSPQSTHKATKQAPHGNQTEAEQYTEGRVGWGGVGSGSDEKETTSLSPQPEAAADRTKTRLKPHQQEAGIFLDLIERHEGIPFLNRAKVINQARKLFSDKVPNTTPERLLDCYCWLKENDSFLASRAPPQVIGAMIDRYPAWAAGKLQLERRDFGRIREPGRGVRPRPDQQRRRPITRIPGDEPAEG